MTGWAGDQATVRPGERRRLIVGVSGSSAPQLGYVLLRALQAIDEVETHLVLSPGATRSIQAEMGLAPAAFEELADVVHSPGDLASTISSGSFATMGMVVMPCSMRSLAAIATGNSGDLLTRAADVCLKERRRLVLVTRETPLNLIHIRNMETVTLAGATVLPPVPAFYHRPATIEDLLSQTVGKALDQFGIQHQLFQRWSGSPDHSVGTVGGPR
ncbi:MAG: UbiX family flavin prenyltransferase [Streptosporangiaceae bacterium]|nr:UbiX family flavin prenyltransferase [Streptosporangiaceae bacterium]